jgi:hypothetical protein
VGGKTVFVEVGVNVLTCVFGVKVGGWVNVTVTGRGEGNIGMVAVAVASGTNSTREMESAPNISATDTAVTTSAFPNSRSPRIISFHYRLGFPIFHLQWGGGH